jgi:hypothetical protein
MTVTSSDTQRMPSDLDALVTQENLAEEDGLDPFDRLTCRTHHQWVHRCVGSPVHVVVVTGHRWCRDCAVAAGVAVDELCGTVYVTCPRCGRPPAVRATGQIIRACRKSLALCQAARSRRGL